MVQILIASVVVIVLLLVFKRPIDDLIDRNVLVKILQYALITASTILILFFGFMGLGEMLGGDLSGAMHFATTLPFFAIIFLLLFRPQQKTRRRPRAGVRGRSR